jgi:hypothetical protein
MKNELYRIILAAFVLAGLMLPASLPRAAEPSPEPVPPIGTFNDFEELSWEEEFLEAQRSAAIMRSEGRDTTGNYKTMAFINLALKGNALAAANLSASYTFIVFPETLENYASMGETPFSRNSFWEQYADELTSPGWAGYMADVTDRRREFKTGRDGRHPAAYFWFLYKNGKVSKYKDVHHIAYEGYAYAQADLSAVYSQPEGSSWVRKKEQNWVERMLALAEASAGQGEPYGLYVMGHNYLDGLYGDEPDPETALMFFMLARKVLKQGLRPGVLSHPGDDDILLYGIHDNLPRVSPSMEMTARAEARADEWLAGFIKEREAAYAPVREKRARIVADMREKYRDEYIRVYGILKAEGNDLPPSIF